MVFKATLHLLKETTRLYFCYLLTSGGDGLLTPALPLWESRSWVHLRDWRPVLKPSGRAAGLILPWRASSSTPLSTPAGHTSGQNVARVTALLVQTAHILSYVMLGKAECRPSKLKAFILFMWLHLQLWHCKWRKGRGKGCFFSKMQTQEILSVHWF